MAFRKFNLALGGLTTTVSVFVNSTNITTNIETAMLSNPRDTTRGSCQILTQIEKCIHECPRLSQIVSIRWRDCISKGHHVGFNQSSSSGFPPSTPRWFINLVRRTTLKSFLTGFNHNLNFSKAAHLSSGQEQLWNLSHSFKADSIFKADRIYLFH